MTRPILEQSDPKQDAEQFVEGIAELDRKAQLRRLEEAAKQFLRDTDMGPVADHMSVHAWMAAFAMEQKSQPSSTDAALLDQYRKSLEKFGVTFADNGFIRHIPRDEPLPVRTQIICKDCHAIASWEQCVCRPDGPVDLLDRIATIRAFITDVIELSEERYAKRQEDVDEGYFDRWAMHQVLERRKKG